MKKYLFSLAAAALLMSGCGGGSGGDDTAVASYDITVERGPVLGAQVTDSAGQTAREIGGGRYRFASAPAYPIYANGGIIDINRDGTVSVGDIANRLTLAAREGTAVTLVNTVAANEEIRTWLKSTYGLTDAQIDNATPSTDRTIAAISDEIFAYAMQNGIQDPTAITLAQLQSIQTQTEARIQEYIQSAVDTAQLEMQLVQQMGLHTMTAAEVQNHQNRQNAASAATGAATGTLTTEQKYTIAYMWNEEKLAKDVYLALNALTPSQTLYNIATNSETQHEASMQSLAQKYDINVFNLTDFSGGYDEAGMNALAAGQYSIPEVQALYDQLYAKGSGSLQAALEVGCMVEVTDINDLDRDIQVVADHADIVQVFSFLRQGSYNHYWSFDRALKAIGVAEGCCSLGDAYCKTPEEYPASNTNAGSGAVLEAE